MSRETAIVVLAAGKGVRMKSETPKVLHQAGGQPLLDRVLATARAFLDARGARGAEGGRGDRGNGGRSGGRTVVVAGAGREAVLAHLAARFPAVVPVIQDPPRGTGDAVRAALPALEGATRVLVLSGDVPLLERATLDTLCRALEGRSAAVAFLTASLPDAAGYGRVVRDPSGRFLRVVEAKDASPAERAITEWNAGVYAFDRSFLDEALPLLTAENAAGEYYLTDLLGIAVARGLGVVAVPVADVAEVLGVNSRAELSVVDAKLRSRAAERAMAGGATLIRPETVTLDDTVTLAADTVVEPFVTLLGRTVVESSARIGQGSVLTDTFVGRGTLVRPYTISEGARIGENAVVGPFSRLREGTDLGKGVHIGNFVETKKAVLAPGAKANHLTYLGDVTVGEKTNVGAGVITCNYDGYVKNPTRIGARVFVGSDVQLVAPVTVGDGAIIGAGTTVTRDVPEDALATSRVPQKVVPGGGAAYHARRRGGVRKER